jgi:hypothetical protein
MEKFVLGVNIFFMILALFGIAVIREKFGFKIKEKCSNFVKNFKSLVAFFLKYL